MDVIRIQDLEVFFQVGVPEPERARPQRLLLCVELEFEMTRAAATDDLATTVDYYSVCQRLRAFGSNRSWRLIEKLAADIAEALLAQFEPAAVQVEVKKFVIPEASYVSVRVRRSLVGGH